MKNRSFKLAADDTHLRYPGRIEPGIDPKAVQSVPSPKLNPFRGLNFFDFEHAAFYRGRTKAVGEVLNVLQNQSQHQQPFVLVTSQNGLGKSSLVRAGILPVLIRGGTALGNGPWRYAVTRPGAARDPFDPLAAALAGKSGLPELQDASSTENSPALASQLSKDPDTAAARISDVLDQSKVQLALVVDQLEELFTGVSPVLQEKYIAALVALVNCEGIFTIATLRSDFYPHCQRFPELLKLISSGGRYELQPPTPEEIGQMIRFPAEAAGLRFEQNPETGRTLDEIILKAAISSPDQLPLLEHLLSRLYEKQLARKDGLLLWSDYRQLGELRNALARHAEFVFSTLNQDEQQALMLVTRQLLAPGAGGESLIYRRTLPYRELIASPKLNQRQRAGAKGLVDRLIKEGLLRAETDPEQRLLITIPQEVLLRKWPRLWQSLSDDPRVIQMRDRLDASIKSWISRGLRRNDLLDAGVGLTEAETLLRDFRSSLSETQIDYVQKSLLRQKRRRRMRYNIGLTAIIAFAAFAVFMGVEQFNAERRRNAGVQDIRETPQNTDVAKERRALETELKEAEGKLQKAQLDADLANQERAALESQLRETAQTLKQVRGNPDPAANQLSKLQTQLKQEQDKAQKAQTDAAAAISRQSALETELKNLQADKAQLTQRNTELANNQRNAVETERQDAQEKLQQVQANSDRVTGQLSDLQTQLKQEQDKAQKAQTDAAAAISRQSALETELKNLQADKAQLTQQNADLANNQRNVREAERKEAQEKLQQVQANSDRTASQINDLQAQLKQEQDKAQKAQTDAAAATSQRNALETELQNLQA
ncbi:MAG: hypothetical protein JO333_01595, partial [Verrucomicrobia bacterium]|nr:hypothetical protein [Verrucomicrobiota bacterium]